MSFKVEKSKCTFKIFFYIDDVRQNLQKLIIIMTSNIKIPTRKRPCLKGVVAKANEFFS